MTGDEFRVEREREIGRKGGCREQTQEQPDRHDNYYVYEDYY